MIPFLVPKTRLAGLLLGLPLSNNHTVPDNLAGIGIVVAYETTAK